MAITRRAVFDVTELTPIPKGSRITIEDYDACSNLYFVEWRGCIYAATPDEILLTSPTEYGFGTDF